MKFYAIQQAEREAQIFIFGDIVPWKWDEQDTSAWSLHQEIKELDADVIHVHINSYGGSVSEGFAIYNVLREHRAKIVTHADGFVASAAIYPFMAGDQRIASSVSTFYFHQVQSGAYGNADDLRKTADDLEKLNDIGLQAFTDAGIDADVILQLEKADTWITPQRALDLGIATEIRKRERSQSATQSVGELILQRLTMPQRNTEPEPEPAPQETPEQAPVQSLLTFLQGVNF